MNKKEMKEIINMIKNEDVLLIREGCESLDVIEPWNLRFDGDDYERDYLFCLYLNDSFEIAPRAEIEAGYGDDIIADWLRIYATYYDLADYKYHCKVNGYKSFTDIQHRCIWTQLREHGYFYLMSYEFGSIYDPDDDVLREELISTYIEVCTNAYDWHFEFENWQELNDYQ